MPKMEHSTSNSPKLSSIDGQRDGRRSRLRFKAVPCGNTRTRLVRRGLVPSPIPALKWKWRAMPMFRRGVVAALATGFLAIPFAVGGAESTPPFVSATEAYHAGIADLKSGETDQ